MFDWKELTQGSKDWSQVDFDDAYNNLVYRLLLRLEGMDTNPYWDGDENSQERFPTIGIGLNFHSENLAVQDALLDLMEVRNDEPTKYRGQIIEAIDELTQGGTFDSLHAIMATAHAVQAANRPTFSLYESEMQEMFKNTMHAGGYESKVDTFITVPLSYERAVLVSLAFNQTLEDPLLGNALKAALNAGDRAEAWFEIRFRSNGGNDPSVAVAKRRFVESQIFGLFDSFGNQPSSEEEALNAFRMLTKHEKKIAQYENSYGVAIATANAELDAIDLAVNVGAVATTHDTLFSGAASLLIQNYAEEISDSIAAIWVAADAQGVQDPGFPSEVQAYTVDRTAEGAVNDLIFGALGSVGPTQTSTLSGGAGDDVFIAGNAAESIQGGIGEDTVSYARSSAGVTVYLDGGTGVGGAAQGDVLTDVENVVGSGFADTIHGSDGANVLNGGDGVDTLNGGAGNDVLDGGDDIHADVMNGGAGHDTYILGVGDTLSDPDGAGTIYFRNTQLTGC